MLYVGGAYALCPNFMLLVETAFGMSAAEEVRHLTCALESGC